LSGSSISDRRSAVAVSQSSGQRLRGAVMGYGFIASRGHFPAYLQRAKKHRDVEIVAVADVCPARRELARRAVPGIRLYPDYRSLLDAEGSALDFVDLCTPPSDHCEIARAALERGLHVLCEKPLAPTVGEASLLLETAAAVRRVIFPCHNYKHAPVVKAIRAILQSGRIGAVRSVTLSTFRNTFARGVPEWRPDWRREKRISGGGIAMDHGSHTFYLAFEWMGGYPTAVTAKMSKLGGDHHDTEDNFNAVLTFPRGLAHAHLSWTAGVRKVLYTLQGELGAITVDDDELELAVADRAAQANAKWAFERRRVASHWMDASHIHWFESLFEQFKGAIADGAFVGKEARDAYFCVQTICNAYRSAEEGCREVALGTEIGWAERWFPMNRVPIGR
jgi:predicted dehydrogenase